MANKPNTNQTKTAQDNLKYDININKVYQDFIQNIDSIRSYVNIGDQNNSKLLDNISKDIFTNSTPPFH